MPLIIAVPQDPVKGFFAGQREKKNWRETARNHGFVAPGRFLPARGLSL